ncbi:MAG: hypothetical protein P8N99_10610 [Luminiphilus sp.]|nr:hypothetical protein [Luminiphilus sp.]
MLASAALDRGHRLDFGQGLLSFRQHYKPNSSGGLQGHGPDDDPWRQFLLCALLR